MIKNALEKEFREYLGDNPDELTQYALDCETHGSVRLTKRQYVEQMSRPNSFWYCPKNPDCRVECNF